MKNICTINTSFPAIENHISYTSDASLSDYDVIIFNPEFPYLSRIDFSSGDSCISIEGGRKLNSAIDHWSRELRNALLAGKTIFFLLNRKEIDSVAVSSTNPRKGSIQYQTSRVDNYQVLPSDVQLRNANGKRIGNIRSDFKGLFDAIGPILQYRVLVTSGLDRVICTTVDDSNLLGGTVAIKGGEGFLTLLPYFDFEGMTETIDSVKCWTDGALSQSRAIVSQLVSIDKSLRTQSEKTPVPAWLENSPKPQKIVIIEEAIVSIECNIAELEQLKIGEKSRKDDLLGYSALLYENGKALEVVIESSLKLLDYRAENYENGDVEIDHIIVSPNGFRMIGETEGKDSSAIGISKFRQLESNINEDFARDDTDLPAKGVLFGNGYRLIDPLERDVEFTEKCLVNAKRLGTALVPTADLYSVVLHILDNPEDNQFKEECRNAIETCAGGIVKFPSIG